MVRHNNPGLMLPGFYFEGRGAKFSENKEDSSKMNTALLGPRSDGKSTAQLREQTHALMKQLFTICLEYYTLGLALRLGPIFWDTIAERWEPLSPLEGRHTEIIATHYLAARRTAIKQGRPSPAGDSLIAMADKLVSLQNKVNTLPPPNDRTLHFQRNALDQVSDQLGTIAVKPRMSAAELAKSIYRLHEEPGPPPADATWPPSHLSAQEKLCVSDARLMSRLVGMTYGKLPSGNMYPDNYANDHSPPLDIKWFLCATALYLQRDDLSNWALFMMPIGFVNWEERQAWYGASGRLSRQYSTIQEFALYAKDQFDTKRRSIAIGFISSWPVEDLGTWESNQAASVVEQREKWLKDCAKFSFLCILDQLSEGVRMTVYDPAHDICGENIPEGMQESPMHILKRRMCAEIHKTLPVKQLFHGGTCCYIKDANGEYPEDLVGSSLRYLRSMLIGHPFLVPRPLNAHIPGVGEPSFTYIRSPEAWFDSGEGLN
ncbi:hypothetical protein GGR57DRAFT_517730 [Xylariaceae sp. FL1272]|nr:hypothetical protein GGR57DRAFT_517730 [Xylariaceae sp. FL1272]